MRIVTFRRARDAMAAGWRSGDPFTWAKRRWRTAKSCGPGAATVASIRAGPCWRGNGDNKCRSPGRARISRKPIARGKPGCLGCTCQTRVRCFAVFAHGTAGTVGARLSLRPLFKRGQTKLQSPGEARRGKAKACLYLHTRCHRPAGPGDPVLRDGCG